MNTQQLSPETIATLAEWDGWETFQDGYRKPYPNGEVGYTYIYPHTYDLYFANPRTLIKIRNELSHHVYNLNQYRDLLPLREKLDNHILAGEYHAAADKAAEIIKKLKG
jgi:hypothetical protein